ncbi:GNAT family N-acetyltransferase [Microbacterium pseudoresistens]|uniref:GNAT superfamily N-acetyltransferase n=1 Tax=Microbacterium pseudoresistens TaxID=640634 RepID=A0A7Y9EXS1_9MICO|nr:GNAT family N-acetyltransferase [Microbacterium pseudoresistens]NYD55721.1 GNAT superfamily N-acetyltransferase [Microbacterium pseudoresistens]
MVTITTKTATIAEWDDVQKALTGGGDGASCQCIWPMIPNKEWQASTRDERKQMLRAEVAATPSPGIVAYVDGEAAGWVRVGPRPAQQRLGRTRAIAAATQEPLDDASVWAVSCFSVRREHRRKGVTTALLDAAVAYAKESGARIIEGYPIDTSAVKTSSNDLFHGALSTFTNAGFTPDGELKPGRTLVTFEV